MWSPPLNWQVRLAMSLRLQVTGADVASRWERLRSSPAASDYLALLTPGSALADPVAQGSKDGGTTCEPLGHFALLDATVLAVDWLELGAQGHRRARFDAEGARWLQP